MTTFLTISVGLLTAVLGAAVGAWLTNKYNNPKQELKYAWVKNVSLLNASGDGPTALTVAHGGNTLTHPRIVDIRLRNQGTKPITQASFHADMPIQVDLDAAIIDVLSVKSVPSTAIAPRYYLTEGQLMIEPSLLKPNQTVVFSMLVDGAADNLKFQSPLADVDVVEEQTYGYEDVIRSYRRTHARMKNCVCVPRSARLDNVCAASGCFQDLAG
ncbi:hypothetical protein ACKI10_44055 [Streptomyces galilaeus]|uniref:hypothetical protein n=1 Tax=Streptomyces galilaeus TaxID=33899 RepID=UPI0038F6CD02